MYVLYIVHLMPARQIIAFKVSLAVYHCQLGRPHSTLLNSADVPQLFQTDNAYGLPHQGCPELEQCSAAGSSYTHCLELSSI
jgi:hypothetical protein